MAEVTCPACDTPVTGVHQVGPVTYVLQPCGHQIDDQVYQDLFVD